MTQLICPIRDVGKALCLEENCALWIKGGSIATRENKEEGIRIHEPVGCCALRRIGEKA
jgi:hypothetical protein